ncbi:MAG: ABC transporter permease, partial [Planctomycetota bacterium]
VICGVLLWMALEYDGLLRLQVVLLLFPASALTAVLLLCANAAGRMLYPPDMGSEGKEVVDLEKENEEAVGLVIQRDRFPDYLFAPEKKQSLLPDGANPVYDKELHSEVFSQGTLMLRLVIMISMVLALPLMAVFLFYDASQSPNYVSYVIIFNMLFGPVFLAGAITGERERQTLDLLLTTVVTPWQILWGKLIVGFRISAVVTCLVVWPLVLAVPLVGGFHSNLPTAGMMFVIILLVCCTNSSVAMTASTFAGRTSYALLATYGTLLTLYAFPIVMGVLMGRAEDQQLYAGWADSLKWIEVTSPFSAVHNLPMNSAMMRNPETEPYLGNWGLVVGYCMFTVAFNVALLGSVLLRLRRRDGFGSMS